MDENNKWEKTELQMEKQQNLLKEQKKSNPRKLTNIQKLMEEEKLLLPSTLKNDNLIQNSTEKLFKELILTQKTISENLNDFNFEERKILRSSFRVIDELHQLYSKSLPLNDTEEIKLLLQSTISALDFFIAKPNNPIAAEDLKAKIDLISKYKTMLGKNLNKNQFKQKTFQVEGLINKDNKNIDMQLLVEKLQKLEKEIATQKSKDYIKEIIKQSNDAKELFDNAKLSEALINSEVQDLKKAKEGHIAYTLSDKLEDKLSNCRIDKYVKFVLLCVVITGMLIINYNLLDFSAESIKESKFWELLAMKLLFNIPLAFLVIFFLNEYNKAKRLFEEFDYKIIMAQTLMNNYNRLKEDFT